MATPILHSYDASPFTQKALRMLGLKRLSWRSVTTPMMPPKDDLLALTGGYRGTPVMQIGADVYIDTQLIAAELERRHPTPTLYPGKDAGLCHALVKWSDAFFRTGLRMTVALTASAWPESFRDDRKGLFPDLDFEDAAGHLAHDSAQLRAHAAFLEQQLSDGRAFLTGADPSLADIQAFSIPWFARPYMPVVEKLWADFTRMRAWEQRVAALGEGTRTPIEAAQAFAEAKGSRSIAVPHADANDAQALQVGMMVEVAADDSQRGAVRGEVVIAAANHIAVRRRHEACGEVVVHFPRLGYRVRRL
jgi:glutathione S-transferase